MCCRGPSVFAGRAPSSPPAPPSSAAPLSSGGRPRPPLPLVLAGPATELVRRRPASDPPPARRSPASTADAPEPGLRCPASSIARHRSLRQSPSSDVAKSGFAAGGSLRPSFFEESAEPAYWRNIPSRSQSNPPQLHPNSYGDGSNPTHLAPTPNKTHG